MPEMAGYPSGPAADREFTDFTCGNCQCRIKTNFQPVKLLINLGDKHTSSNSFSWIILLKKILNYKFQEVYYYKIQQLSQIFYFCIM